MNCASKDFLDNQIWHIECNCLFQHCPGKSRTTTKQKPCLVLFSIFTESFSKVVSFHSIVDPAKPKVTMMFTCGFHMRAIFSRQHSLRWQQANPMGPPVEWTPKPNLWLSVQNSVRRVVENCHSVSCSHVKRFGVDYMFLRQQEPLHSPFLCFSLHTGSSLSLQTSAIAENFRIWKWLWLT